MLFRHMSYGATVAAPPATITLGVRTAYHPNLLQSTHTFSMTLGATVNYLLVKVMAITGASFSEVRWGGAGGTLMTLVVSAVQTTSRCSIYQLINPAPGTADVYVLIGGTARLVAEGVGLIGVATNGSPPVPVADTLSLATAGATSLSGSLDPGGIGNNWLEACLAKAGDVEAMTVTGGSTEVLDVDGGNLRAGCATRSAIDTTVTTGFSWANSREAAMTAALLIPG